MSEQMVGLVMALVWPFVLLVLVAVFWRPLKGLLERDDVELRGPGGFRLSSKNRQAAAQALVSASQKEPAAAIDADEADTKIEVAASGVERLPRAPRVLWVDDHPSNNRYERTMLHSLGMFVDLAIKTDDALARVAAQGPYDVVISDMGRTDDPRAGYTLLAELRRLGVTTPYVIYGLSRAAKDFDESVGRGAVGCTNLPSELIELVTNALRAQDQR
jgi:CheY-like chemotaxis protein